MEKTSTNKNLHKAKNNKKDEFYTQLSDIENELKHYRKHFKNKVVYCNCDDPRVSNFFHYFSYNFEKLGLKTLITTCYKSQERDLFSENKSEQAIYLEYSGDKNGNNVPDADEIGIKPLKGDGDFRSQESIELLKQADIVVTNPPFSLLREYVSQLINYKPLINKISSLKILIVEKDSSNQVRFDKLQNELKSALKNLNYEELISINSEDSNIRFLAENTSSNLLNNLLLSISGEDETLFMILEGSISMDDISNLISNEEK